MQANKPLLTLGPVLDELSRPFWSLSLLLFGVAALAAPLAAQTNTTESAIAGAAFPVAAADWSADADGSKAATLDLAASLAGSDCELREAFAWKAADQAASESLRVRTESAFETAGWSLDPVSHTAEGQRILLARRGSERFVMVWRPEEAEIGLLICRIESAAPVAAPEAAAPPPSAEPALPPAATPVAPPATPEPDHMAEGFDPEVATPAAPPETPIAPPAVMADTATESAAAESAANLWLRLLAVGLLIAGGIGLIVRDFRARALSVEWQWPTASATVERGWVEEEEENDAAGDPVKTYMPMLRYRYHVEGEEFQGGNIGLDDRPLSSAEAALRLLSKYPDFATVEVRYDPDDPSFAVIEAPRPSPGREFYFGLGAIILALAVLTAHLL